ncbi:MAG TPA: 4-hydroxy-3-methylbut-2-enyl diphosphate reductase [Gemmatimonadaceae bacterium]|nr:4-hydroxy-3-methylbut-2-enyl diphosphate reductase [Gemmatimonadaceae bacterium]
MSAPNGDATYVRRGFGLKSEVEGALAADYGGRMVELLRARDYVLSADGVTVRLAHEFGFCYGVERAVDYAYQTRRKFPDRHIVLVGEIIHNPHVNARLEGMGIEILRPRLGADGTPDGFDFSGIRQDDVVLLPAFGVTIDDFTTLREKGCVVVDTTCGSVLNVWKRVESYARDGMTALIHGKYYHEETRATASQVFKHPQGGRYLVVRHMEEAQAVCDYIEGRGDREAFLQRFAHAASPGFDPDRDLARVGVANQTTMLARESLAIGEAVGAAIERAHGAAYRAANFRTFDTICSATQDRQDAVRDMLREPPDLMVVIGGFNSSNTISLAALCAEVVPTYHVADASGIDPETGRIHIREPGVVHNERTVADWLPRSGPVTVGLTAGASTPNNKIGEAVARIFASRGVDVAEHATFATEMADR